MDLSDSLPTNNHNNNTHTHNHVHTHQRHLTSTPFVKSPDPTPRSIIKVSSPTNKTSNNNSNNNNNNNCNVGIVNNITILTSNSIEGFNSALSAISSISVPTSDEISPLITKRNNNNEKQNFTEEKGGDDIVPKKNTAPLINTKPLKEGNKIQQEGIQLKDHCLAFIIKHLPTIDFNPLRMMPSSTGIEVVKAVQKAIGKNWVVDNCVDRSRTVEVHTLPTVPTEVSVVVNNLIDESVGNDGDDDSSDEESTAGGDSEESSGKGRKKKKGIEGEDKGKERENEKSDNKDDDEDEEDGEDEEIPRTESLHLSDLLGENSKITQQQQPVKLQKMKRKKLVGAKDIDDLFG